VAIEEGINSIEIIVEYERKSKCEVVFAGAFRHLSGRGQAACARPGGEVQGRHLAPCPGHEI
jgi:hypothetical protein